ncbi:MAG: NifB/NifX family molybdenum-iron cluster-binding protein [Clostridia bacterium]|nr:NifB/NifX family molybdenum-iron cluster-binding protein [Clostridia bacterium]
MKIAVTYENGEIFQHFGHTEQFKLYSVTDGKITNTQIVDTLGSGHGALAGLLSALGVDTLICGGIGGGAQSALANAGIKLYGGASGDADAAVEALLAGELAYDPNAKCDHHDHHGEGHSCGDHGCGSHSCH